MTVGLPVVLVPAATAAEAVGIRSPAPRNRSNCPRTAASTAHASGVAPGMPGPDPDEGVVTSPAAATEAADSTGTVADGTGTTAVIGAVVTEDCNAPSLPASDTPDPTN